MAHTRTERRNLLMASWSDASLTLGKKLADIGDFYMELYPHPVYFGGFNVHTNQEVAKLLQKLKTARDEKAYEELIATLYALPNSSFLGQLLIECISGHKLLSMHVNPKAILPDEDEGIEGDLDAAGQTYDLLLRSQNLSGDFNKGIANALSKLHTYPALASTTSVKITRPGSFADSLADAGDKYSSKYPKPTSFFCFFTAHTHQTEARLLSQLRGKTDEEAIAFAGRLLSRLSKGELSRGIIDATHTLPSGTLDSHFDMRRHGSFEQHVAKALLRMATPTDIGPPSITLR